MPTRTLVCGAMGLLALAQAAPAATVGEAPERERNLVVYGEDPCPEPEDAEEIVVCARQPEEERYRIPGPLRRDRQRREASWSSQAEALEDAQRDTRPDSCSAVGSFGQSGCTQQVLRRWRAERDSRPRQRRR